MNIKEIKINPSKYYETPENLVTEDKLSLEEKIEVLESWAQEIRELQDASNENMPGDNVAQQLEAVSNCLLKLQEESERK